MITENIVKNEQAENTTDNSILNFLDYTVLLLSQMNTAEEVDLVMDDFISDDFTQLLEDNKQLFSILSIVWVDAFNRVFLTNENESKSFPLKVLWIPVLFHRLGWGIENKQYLQNIKNTAIERSKEDHALYYSLITLFIDGVEHPLENSLNEFEKRTQAIAKTEEDLAGIQQIITDLKSLGWSQFA